MQKRFSAFDMCKLLTGYFLKVFGINILEIIKFLTCIKFFHMTFFAWVTPNDAPWKKRAFFAIVKPTSLTQF